MPPFITVNLHNHDFHKTTVKFKEKIIYGINFPVGEQFTYGDFCFIFQAAWDSKNTIFIAHLQSQTQKEKAAVSYSGAFFGHEKARRKRYIACDELGWGDKTDPP